MDCSCSRFAGMTRDEIEEVASRECNMLMNELPILTTYPDGLKWDVMERVGIRLGFGSFTPRLHRTPTLPSRADLFRESSCFHLNWFYTPESLKTLKGMILDGELHKPNRYMEKVRNRDPTPIRWRHGRKTELFFDYNVHHHPTKDMESMACLPYKDRLDMEKDICMEVRRSFDECWKEMIHNHRM